MKKTYLNEITYIRALACLLVVMTHISLAYPVTDLTPNMKFSLLMNQIARVGTPIFCIISGFLLFYSNKKRQFDGKRFLKSRVDKIVIPYLIWSAIYFLLTVAMGKAELTLTQILRDIFLGESYVHLYFIIVVIQFYLIFPFIMRISTRKNIIYTACTSLLLMVIWYMTRHTYFEMFYHRANILNWIGFFMMGAVFAYYYEEIQQFIKKYGQLSTYAVLICLIVILIEINLPHLFQSDRMMNIIFVPITVLFMLHILNGASTYTKNILNYIGNRAMPVYLVHLLVIGVLGEVITPGLWNVNFMLLDYIAVILVTLFTVEVLCMLPHNDKLFPIPKQDQNAAVQKVKTILHQINR